MNNIETTKTSYNNSLQQNINTLALRIQGLDHTYMMITLFKKLEFKCSHDYFQGNYIILVFQANTQLISEKKMKKYSSHTNSHGCFQGNT